MSASVARCSGGESRMAPSMSWSRPYLSAISVPNDQPTSQGRGRPRSCTKSIAAARSNASARPPSKAPSLVPRGDVVPRVLNRSTARSASAGSRAAALRRMCESMNPPAVGSGCSVTRVATGSRSSGHGEFADERQPIERLEFDVLPQRGKQHRAADLHISRSSSNECASGVAQRGPPDRRARRRRAMRRHVRGPRR